MIKVLLVTSWGTNCGIADYAFSLKQAVEAADAEIEILPDSETLDPFEVRRRYCSHRDVAAGKITIDLIHLNHHDALHSRWTADHVHEFVKAGLPVVVTYHDTRERLIDCPKLAALAQVASSTIVHEPVEGLKAIYWRQGIPAAAQQPADYVPGFDYTWKDGNGILYSSLDSWKAFPQQPVLGTIGFHFPWKNLDRLAKLTGEEGWALVILSNNATEEDESKWRNLNSSILVVRKFLPQDQAVNYLAGCDATAFMYECGNSGTSGAIRLGIAARKPVLALKSCRQFRDLFYDSTERAIWWMDDWGSRDDSGGFVDALRGMRGELMERINLPIAALAHHDSWAQRGKDHAGLYRLLIEGPPK